MTKALKENDSVAAHDTGIVGLDVSPWDGPWMNRQQILSRLGAYWPTLYSNGLLTTWQRNTPEFRSHPLRPRFESRGKVEIEIASRALLRWPRWTAYDRCLMRWHAAHLTSRIRRTGVDCVIGYIFYPHFAEYAQSRHFDRVVYHVYDMYERMIGWDSRLAANHAYLMQQADVVIASSPETGRYLSSQFGRSVEIVTNGVDYLRYAEAGLPEPKSLQQIPRPRIGHVGRLNRKIDFGRIAEIALRCPDWQIVLVGPVVDLDDIAKRDLEACQERSNVWLIGEQPSEELPAFMAHMDVNSIFYALRDDLWTQWGFPLKLYEYLAVGRPVVASNMPCFDGMGEVVATAKDLEEWIACISDALAGNAPGDEILRKKLARHNDWDAKVERIRELIDPALPANGAGVATL